MDAKLEALYFPLGRDEEETEVDEGHQETGEKGDSEELDDKFDAQLMMEDEQAMDFVLGEFGNIDV
jgi:hypothetical protein